MAVVEVISVGSELVLGQTLDTNAHWLSRRLAALGLPVTWRTTVPDDLPEVTAALRSAGERADVVVVTGGLGPTRDDVTREALAAAAGVGLVRDEAAWQHIADLFRRWGRPMASANEVQAMIPVGGRAIANPHGTAPGIEMRLGRAGLYAMPGVPREMMAMFDDAVAPRLAALAGGAAVVERTLNCIGAGESLVGERIHDLMAPDRRPRVGTTVANGIVGVRIVARSANPDEGRQLVAETEREIRRRLGPLVFGADEETVEGVAGRLLIDRRLTVAVAESVTGGLIADRLTDVPGISASFLEGVVAYSNRAKTDLLGVPAALFETVGAVSEEVAAAMASGVRRRVGADLALSTTGIAGPTGGSAEKPVGLVYVGLATSGSRPRVVAPSPSGTFSLPGRPAGTGWAEGSTHFDPSGRPPHPLPGGERASSHPEADVPHFGPESVRVERFVLHGDRRTIKDRAARTALNLLRMHLLQPPRPSAE